jgi:uncharacterized membrane protein YdjX (TVP38/TMEM64 family)
VTPQRLALSAWATLLAFYGGWLWRSGLTPIESWLTLLQLLAEHPAGPWLYALLCLVRPLFLFSSSVLTLGAGSLYGPGWGALVVVVGQYGGALLAYALARTLGGRFVRTALAHPRLAPWAARAPRHTFWSVLTLRLLFVPFDLVNYSAGALRLPWRPFFAATVLGSLTGSLTYVLFGASLGDLGAVARGERPTFDPRLFALSLTLAVASWGFSRLLQRRLSEREVTT